MTVQEAQGKIGSAVRLNDTAWARRSKGSKYYGREGVIVGYSKDKTAILNERAAYLKRRGKQSAARELSEAVVILQQELARAEKQKINFDAVHFPR